VDLCVVHRLAIVAIPAMVITITNKECGVGCNPHYGICSPGGVVPGMAPVPAPQPVPVPVPVPAPQPVPVPVPVPAPQPVPVPAPVPVGVPYY